MIYPKINTIWKRDPQNKFKILEYEYSHPEFKVIRSWSITEEIHGVNIRVCYQRGRMPVTFFGRTDNAQIPIPLLAALVKTFPYKKLRVHFDKFNVCEAVFYGKGYGAKIQKGGGLYRKDQAFIMFGAQIGGQWCDRNVIKQLAADLNIDCVPVFAMTEDLEWILNYVKNTKHSRISLEERPLEGIVATSEPLMLFKNGNPIMWKLKCKDFQV